MKETPWTKADLLETSGSYWKTCALHAGVKLDLFTAIGGGGNGRRAAWRNGSGETGAASRRCSTPCAPWA